MTEEGVAVVLITANVGSLFEDPVNLLQQWVRQMLEKVVELKPLFVALHLQEVGGKTYEKSMSCVQEFIQALCEAQEMRDFPSVRIYIDEDFQSAEHFTALGNIYFGHKNLKDLQIWDFSKHTWRAADEKQIFAGNIEEVATKEKSKFPQHFFPECKWSRKGFMRTRWQIDGSVIDLVNIHLFHDASNLAACEEFPSVYCKTRRRALVHTLQRFHLDDVNGFAPFFLFGDFNFRCDTKGVIQELTRNLTVHRVQSFKTDSSKLHYRNSVGDNILTVGKKEFIHADHQLKFKESWLKDFDRELEALGEVLIEYPIEFPPSYPYEEDPEMPTDYMSTRCPAWCDRILMSPYMFNLVVDGAQVPDYHIIGENVCMGDHKPVYLKVNIRPNQGTYRYCTCPSNSNNTHKGNGNGKDSGKCTIEAPRGSAVVARDDGNTYCPFNSLQNTAAVMALQSRTDSTNLIECNSRFYSDDVASDIAYSMTQSKPRSVTRRMPYPSIRINIIDSNNANVCMCKVPQRQPDPSAGAICTQCCNVIQSEMETAGYRLDSSRQHHLDNEMLVNRMGMHYLNAYLPELAPQQLYHQDPYTPESIESHSPLPEAYSLLTTATISIHSRMSNEKEKSSCSLVTQPSPKEEAAQCIAQHQPDKIDADSGEKVSSRGIVQPGQLISKLEDLQRANECASITSYPVKGYIERDAGRSQNLNQVVHDILSSYTDDVWTVQTSSNRDDDPVRTNGVTLPPPTTHFVRIKPLNTTAEKDLAVIGAMNLKSEETPPAAAETEVADNPGITVAGDVTANFSTSYNPILKETTV